MQVMWECHAYRLPHATTQVVSKKLILRLLFQDLKQVAIIIGPQLDIGGISIQVN